MGVSSGAGDTRRSGAAGSPTAAPPYTSRAATRMHGAGLSMKSAFGLGSLDRQPSTRERASLLRLEQAIIALALAGREQRAVTAHGLDGARVRAPECIDGLDHRPSRLRL